MYPVLSLFGHSFYTYGIFCLLGGTIAILLAIHNGTKLHLSRFSMLESCTWTILGSFLGAKLLYLLVSYKDIVETFRTDGIHWHAISTFLEGGFVFYGGLLGGVLTLLCYTHHFRLSLTNFLICIAPAVPLAHAFGRIGCFFAGCCYGIPFAPPIGICLRNAIGDAPTDIPLFPVQLLESALNFLLATGLQIGFRKLQQKEVLISIYLLGYAVIRGITEQFRYDAERGIWFGFSTSEWISIGVGLTGLLLLLHQKRSFKSTASN